MERGECGEEGGPSGSRNQSDGKAEKHGRTRRAVIGWVAGCGSVAWFVSASGPVMDFLPLSDRPVQFAVALCNYSYPLRNLSRKSRRVSFAMWRPKKEGKGCRKFGTQDAGDGVREKRANPALAGMCRERQGMEMRAGAMSQHSGCRAGQVHLAVEVGRPPSRGDHSACWLRGTVHGRHI